MLLSSDRVVQLKKEIQDLDSKLMNTNTINFEEIRNSLRESYDYTNDFSSEDESLRNKHEMQSSYKETYEIEEEILKQSQGRTLSASQ